MKYLLEASILLALALAGCGSAGASHGFDSTTGSGSGGASGAGGGLSGAGGASVLVPLRASAIAVGARHSCALLTDQTVACWGDGSVGQLGDGSSGTGHHTLVAVRVQGISGATALRAGDDTTCAVVSGGYNGGAGVVCWGDGTYGQLGDGTAYDGYFQPVPASVHGLEGVVDLSVRGSSACAALPDGSVRCWGRNGPQGQLGFMSPECGPYAVQVDGETSSAAQPCQKTPHGVPGIAAAGAVVTSGQHSCEIDAGGGLSCWGADGFGQLGDGMSGPTAFGALPLAVPGIGKAVQVALGISHTCALVGDQRDLLCWGDDSLGQLGFGSPSLDAYQTKPLAIPGFSQVVDLDAAQNVTCVVLADSRVRCWGDATILLSPNSTSPSTPVPPTLVPKVTGVVEVRTSGDHACARHMDGRVVCWGRNDSGQVGNGTTSLADDSLTPVEPPATP